MKTKQGIELLATGTVEKAMKMLGSVPRKVVFEIYRIS